MAHTKRLTDAIRGANHENLIANVHLVRVAQRRRCDTFRHFFELQQSHVRLDIRTDHTGIHYRAVRKLDTHNIYRLHYVRSGQDLPII
jgi:hypothetical protein